MTEPAPQLPAGWDPAVEALGTSWSVLPVEVRNRALEVAVRALWALSGRRFGTVELTLAPYLPPPRVDWYDGHRAGLGLNAAAGYAAGGAAGCAPARAFRLPGPVVAVAEVVVDAVVLGPSAWHLDPDDTLVRVDGGGWPVGQDVYVPRWVVRYVRGIPADVQANTAAARYALELARGLTADPKCKLPARTRSITRQGISLELAAPEDLSEGGLTGVGPVDAWLRAVNPAGLAEAATVWSPAVSRHRVIAVHSGAAA
jgi:hypothetical protein